MWKGLTRAVEAIPQKNLFAVPPANRCFLLGVSKPSLEYCSPPQHVDISLRRVKTFDRSDRTHLCGVLKCFLSVSLYYVCWYSTECLLPWGLTGTTTSTRVHTLTQPVTLLHRMAIRLTPRPTAITRTISRNASFQKTTRATAVLANPTMIAPFVHSTHRLSPNIAIYSLSTAALSSFPRLRFPHQPIQLGLSFSVPVGRPFGLSAVFLALVSPDSVPVFCILAG